VKKINCLGHSTGQTGDLSHFLETFRKEAEIRNDPVHNLLKYYVQGVGNTGDDIKFAPAKVI